MFDYDIYWINCSENRVRYNHMRTLLENNFPNNKCHHVEAIMHKPKYNGITIAHMVAVMKGMSSGKPFLVLEDDIGGGNGSSPLTLTNDLSFVTPPCFVEDIKKSLKNNVENNSKDNGEKDLKDEKEADLKENEVQKQQKPDAIYLGLSYWGNMKMGRKKLLAECMEKDEKVVLINNKVFMKKGARGEDWDDNFFRIRDMYGAHAILYISKNYMVETLKICIMAVSMNKPHDIYLPKLQKKYLVLGQKQPWFYQLARLGGQEMGTNINFSGVRKITSENL
jgi:hypothetical protein